MRHICSVLRPPQLRKRIENDLALYKANLKKDCEGFCHHVIEEAVACDEFVSLYEKSDNAKIAVLQNEQRLKGSSSHDKFHRKIPTVS